MKNLIKKPVFIVSIIIVAAFTGYYFFENSNKKQAYELFNVKKGNVIQEVSVSGRIKPAEKIDLAFEKSGRVASINAEIGDKASAGQILIRLENADAAAQLAQAEADLKIQKANLSELRRGARLEEIQLQEIKTAAARTGLEDAAKNLLDKLQDAYTKSDDAVRNKIDQFFENPATPLPRILFYIKNYQLRTDTESSRVAVQDILNSWQQSLKRLSAGSDLYSCLNTSKNNLDQLKSFADKAALAVNSALPDTIFSQTVIDSWKASVAAARININTAISNLLTAEEKLEAAQSNLKLAEQELTLKKTGAASEQIAAQEARVEQAEANIKNFQAQLAKTILRSPINGIIASQDAKIGQIVPANSPVVSVMSSFQFEIEADIYEEDITKIKIGAPADIKIVAFPKKTFNGKVIFIDETEKIIDGAVYYKIKIAFDDEPPEGVKPTMTADIVIRTESRQNVLIVPREAIQKKQEKTFVEVLSNGSLEERGVEIGLKGADTIEIISGLAEGERVAIR